MGDLVDMLPKPAGRPAEEPRRGGDVEEPGHFLPRAFHDSITSLLILKTWPIRTEGISPRWRAFLTVVTFSPSSSATV